jgi:hypothetical protein
MRPSIASGGQSRPPISHLVPLSCAIATIRPTPTASDKRGAQGEERPAMRPAVLTRSTDHWRALRPRRTPEIAVRSGLGRARGALVGAAKAANGALDVGDVITSLDGEPVRDFRALARLTGGMRPGTAVEVSVLRRGEAKTVALRLGKLPDEPLQAADSVGRPTSRQGGVNCHARLCR